MSPRSVVFIAVGFLVAATALAGGLFQISQTHSEGAPDTTFQTLSAGGEFTCGLTTDGHVMCWGDNGFGQLGDGTLVSRSTPAYVCATSSSGPCEPSLDNVLAGVTAITSGNEHTCAVTSTGGVKCWGTNGLGQLGDGTNAQRTKPVDVVGLGSGVVAVSAGLGFTFASHSCALTELGGVKCWGYNGSGQLGNQTLDDSDVPVDVFGLQSGVTAIATGARSSCANLSLDGSVVCWGFNENGQLGDDRWNCIDQCSVPVLVCASGTTGPCTERFANILMDSVEVSVGGLFTCARVEAAPVLAGAKCWGANAFGYLGDGTTTERHTPVDVNGLSSGVGQISSGLGHICAVMSDGTVLCWGGAGRGRLGNGTSGQGNFSSTPVTVCSDQSCGSPLTDIVHVVAGVGHTCAITSSGTVKCWGWNTFGQLGVPGTGDELTPVELTGLQPKPSPTPTTATPGITETPTSTPTATPTSTPTATPTVLTSGDVGDVNCDGSVNAIDAALVLQFNAGLVGSLPCEDAADVNGDGDITSVDAALILQLTAGLLDSLGS